MNSQAPFQPAVVVFDVDGVLTPGNFFYSAEGKVMKEFGADDNDALCLLRPHVSIHFVTGDRKGFPITQRRVAEDMKFPLELVSTLRRSEWMATRWPLEKVIYMGDGIFDNWVFNSVGYGICVADGCVIAKQAAHYTTQNPGGRRAVSEAVLHILEKFYEPYDPHHLPKSLSGSGEWTL
ncbi:MAG: HAD hydrolase family protein [Deltaproteobacteria bacterium]|nr:HAD hydrolase family protein [Deltaproteobacteria bacterium]MBI3293355.1 HAD hydrolase family protein [Deltaproteobacteria bacterium]